MSVVAEMMRGMLIAAEGCDLLVSDFSNIEGRGIAWLAGEEWKLEAFRQQDAGTGPGIYELTYVKSFGVPVETVVKGTMQREIGKAGKLISQDAVQIHGGMGMTDELNVGHFFKRVTMIESQFGNTDWHLRRYTDLSAG